MFRKMEHLKNIFLSGEDEALRAADCTQPRRRSNIWSFRSGETVHNQREKPIRSVKRLRGFSAACWAGAEGN